MNAGSLSAINLSRSLPQEDFRRTTVSVNPPAKNPDEALLTIQGKYHVVHRLDEGAEAFFARPQRLLRPFALGDVRESHKAGDQLPGGVIDRSGVDQFPTLRAV